MTRRDFFGAGNGIRTCDLLITKSVQTLKSQLSSPFAPFPLGDFRTNLLSYPFLPAPFFPVVGRDVGQKTAAQNPLFKHMKT